MNDWRFDEYAHAGDEHLDPAYVEGYERKARYDPIADIARLRARGMDRSSLVVDVGAGTGAFAAAVAPLCRKVVAVDVSPAMCAAIRRRVAEDDLDNVVVLQTGALDYRHDGPPADFVFARNVLHHLPDFWKGIALFNIQSMLRPGGVLRLHDLVFDFEPSAANAAIEHWFEGAASHPSDGFTASELATHVRTEHSTYTWILEGLLMRAGLRIVERVVRKSVYASYTCVRTLSPA